MKQLFMLVLIAVVPLAILTGLTYSFVKWAFEIIQDWRLAKELKEIREYTEEAKVRRVESREARLNNGCDHAFGAGVGFPPDVCPKCGLEREKPLGFCDHVWQGVEGDTPRSVCEKCGKKYQVTGST